MVDRRIGTVGMLGQGTDAVVLKTYNVDTGRYSRQWFTFETVELLGLMRVPISEIVVQVHNEGKARL